MLNSPRIYKFFVLILAMGFASCGSSKPHVVTSKKEYKSRNGQREVVYAKKNNAKPVDRKAYKIVKKAETFKGTKYKYGGTTKKGIDCSGLIYVSFLVENVALPRTSRAMSLEGERLYLKEVTMGDLLFFQTNKNRKVINHVGLVVDVLPKGILFIHSSTSRGVIVSSLSESYWRNNFVMARRVM